MSRKTKRMSQAEISRYVRAIRAGGLDIQKTVIDSDGTISLFHNESASPVSAFTLWKGRKDADVA